MTRYLDVHRGRHARSQPQVFVRYADPDRIRDDAVVVRGIQADSIHRAREKLLPERIHAELHGLARPHTANVRLVDQRVELQQLQRRGEHEERRRRHAGLHRLAAVDTAIHHDSVDWCIDLCVAQVQPCRFQPGLRLNQLLPCRQDLRLARAHVELGGFELLQRLELFVVQLLHAITSSLDVRQLQLLRGDVVLLALDRRFLDLDLHFEQRGIDLGQQLARRDHRIEVRVDGDDGAGYLRTHVDAAQGFDRPGGLNCLGDGAA